jgi:hypothetical protein
LRDSGRGLGSSTTKEKSGLGAALFIFAKEARQALRVSALSDQVESLDRKEFAPIQKLGKHVLVGKAGPLFRDML